MKKVYLKSNIAIEPLFCYWYSWSYLIPPQTAGLYLKNRYLKLMDSFLENPKLHQDAAKNERLIGGQFVNIPDDQIEKIKDIVVDIKKNALSLINLAEDIENVNQLLLTEGTGYSLEGLYKKIPDQLRGCVELVYNHNNFPMLNFFEKPIYDRFYNEKLQSAIMTPIKTDKRKFVLSTPRICDEGEINIPLSLNSPLLDELCLSRSKGVFLDQYLDVFKLNSQDKQLFLSYFTENSPKNNTSDSYIGDGIRVRYMGHACVLLQTKNVSILVDPLISYFQPNSGVERFDLDDLPEKIDYVILTHSHLDHVAFETLMFLKHKVKNFIMPSSLGGTLLDPKLKTILKLQGFQNLIELDCMEEIIINNGFIMSLPFLGEHGDLSIRTKSAFCVELIGKKILFAADSNNLDTAVYDYFHEKLGNIDFLFLGMECQGAPLDWIYGPLLTTKIKHKDKQSRRYSGSDAEKAIAIVKSLNPRNVCIYAMGQEDWLSHIMSLNYRADSIQMIEAKKFLKKCAELKINANMPYGKFEWLVKK